MKLSPKQRAALEWLETTGGWTTVWWGGNPHCGWPKEMRENTYTSLATKGLIQMCSGKWAEKICRISDDGRKALTASEGTT
jgi:hypothetical protein